MTYDYESNSNSNLNAFDTTVNEYHTFQLNIFELPCVITKTIYRMKSERNLCGLSNRKIYETMR